MGSCFGLFRAHKHVIARWVQQLRKCQNYFLRHRLFCLALGESIDWVSIMILLLVSLKNITRHIFGITFDAIKVRRNWAKLQTQMKNL